MKRTVPAAILLAGVIAVPARSEEFPATKLSNAGTIEYVSASGKALGSVTTIGGVTYYHGPDGAIVATSTIVAGRKIYKSY